MGRLSVVEPIQIFDNDSIADAASAFGVVIDFIDKEPSGVFSLGYNVAVGTVEFTWEISYDYTPETSGTAVWIPYSSCEINGATPSTIKTGATGLAAVDFVVLVAAAMRIKATATGAVSGLDAYIALT